MDGLWLILGQFSGGRSFSVCLSSNKNTQCLKIEQLSHQLKLYRHRNQGASLNSRHRQDKSSFSNLNIQIELLNYHFNNKEYVRSDQSRTADLRCVNVVCWSLKDDQWERPRFSAQNIQQQTLKTEIKFSL